VIRDWTLVVTKRDGTRERFSLTKLQGCLAWALQSSGEDPRIAGHLARAIETYVTGGSHRRPLTTEHVYQCACTALAHTGFAAAATALEVYRRHRAARRRRLRVTDARQPEPQLWRWRKDMVVTTLRGTYQLGSVVARFLAGRIEQRVFELGRSVLSTALLNELTREEVLAWGLMDGATIVAPGEPARPGPLARGWCPN
jgi:hypothetical protein